MILSESSNLIFKKRYAIHEDESWQELSERVAQGGAQVEPDYKYWKDIFAFDIYNMLFLPGGRILRNVGRPRGSLFNCYCINVDDTIESIAYNCAKALILWSEGGGVGFNFNSLRPENAPIVQKGGESTGPMSFMSYFNAGAETIKTGGARRAAALGLMLCTHPNIVKFIKAKEKEGKFNNFNLSVGVTEKFLECIERDGDWDLSFNQKRWETLKAKDLWDLIINGMVNNGEPGLINWDNLRSNNSWYFSPIVGTNPCGEAVLSHLEVCNLGSLVLPNFITGSKNTNWQLMEKTVHNAVRFLDNIIQVNRYVIDEIKSNAFNSRRIGIGVMGLAEYLFAKKLKYGSEEAVQETERLMRNIRNFIYEASVKIAEEKEPFPKFDPVLYSKSHFIRTLPAKIRKDIKKYGIRNVTGMALAPTGCLVGNTLIPSNKGYIKIHKYDNINTTHPIKLSSDIGLSHFKKFFNQGIANTIKITTEYGYNIEGTYDHKLRVITDGNGYMWKKLEELTIDDYVVLKKGHIFKKDTWMRDCVSELIGFYMADGWWQVDGKYSRRLFFKIHEDEVDYLLNLLNECFKKTFNINPIVRDSEGKSKKIEVNSKKLYDWFFKYNCIKKYSHNAFIPDIVLNGDIHTIIGFIRGIFIGDGGFNKTNERITFNTTSKVLAEQIHILLLGLGIPSNLSVYDNVGETVVINNREVNVNYPYNRICLSTYYSRILYDILRVDNNIDSGLPGRNFESIPVFPYEENKFNELYKKDNREITYTTKYNYDEKILNPNWFVKNNLFMDKIKSIEFYENKNVYDLEVNDVTHTYVANGFITHNTISLLPEVTSCIEPLFCKAYLRHDEISDRAYIHSIYKDIIEKDESTPNWYVDSFDLKPQDHFEMQSVCQKYTDGAVSKTINCPKGFKTEQLSDLLLEYIRDLKGVTLYVDGSREGQILNPMNRKDARKYIIDEKEILGQEERDCSTGACEI